MSDIRLTEFEVYGIGGFRLKVEPEDEFYRLTVLGRQGGLRASIVLDRHQFRELLASGRELDSALNARRVRVARVAVRASDDNRPPSDVVASVAAYLPHNYRAEHMTSDEEGAYVLVTGTDDHGWTMDDYVIPRLQSGLYGVREIAGE